MFYEFKRYTNATKTTQQIIESFGESLTNVSTVQRWFKKFKKGDENLENVERRRHESILNNDDLRKTVETNISTTVRELAKEFNASRTTILCHLKEIKKTKKFSKWVINELSDYQKMCRYKVCSSLNLRNKNDLFLKRLVIYNEKRIIYDNCERPRQWLDKNETLKYFPKLKLSPKKAMVTI